MKFRCQFITPEGRQWRTFYADSVNEATTLAQRMYKKWQLVSTESI